jgi:hypothetical protein
VVPARISEGRSLDEASSGNFQGGSRGHFGGG